MPLMDGFEAARRIKQAAGEELVPIIFLTSLTEGEALVRCLEAGGDDFLAKPYNRVILEAKINAMERLRRLQDTVLKQRDLIAKHNEHLLTEQRVAKAVFDKVTHSGCLDAPNIRYLQSPYAVFNGDLMLAAFKPSGGMHVLLGDFTGHGLPAAIGAMPLAEVFYGMTAKGYSLAEVLREINAKLKRILPVGVFCCATMLNLSFQRRVVEVWCGGLPDGYLYRAASAERVPLVVLSGAPAAHEAASGLLLHYQVTGQVAGIQLPPAAPPGAADGLWQHTCMEAFVSPVWAAHYREFNFSPNGQWMRFDFDDYVAGADEARARETRLKLERAGLKTYTHVAQTAEGRRIRVRVGPYESRAEAEKVATRVKALGLPAAILTL